MNYSSLPSGPLQLSEKTSKRSDWRKKCGLASWQQLATARGIEPCSTVVLPCSSQVLGQAEKLTGVPLARNYSEHDDRLGSEETDVCFFHVFPFRLVLRAFVYMWPCVCVRQVET